MELVANYEERVKMISYKAISDIGKVRQNNEDTIKVAQNKFGDFMFLVADGMGGHKAGDVASKIVGEIVEKAFSNLEQRIDYENFLQNVVINANKEVYKQSLLNINFDKMGTTLSILILSRNTIYIGHIGDSRIYYLANNKIIQLTKDHTLVQAMIDAKTLTIEESKNASYKNILLQAIGTSKNIKLDIKTAKIPKECQFILCSDGLTGKVDDQEILNIMNQELTIEEKVRSLIDLANNKDGSDNVSVIGIERK